MADFAMWAAAGMVPLGFTAEQFMSAYRANIQDGQTSSVDSSPVGEAVTRLMAIHPKWIGTATELIAALAHVSDDAMTRNPAWPKSARWMTGAITRLAPALRAKGIGIDRQRSGDARLISLCRKGNLSSLASLPSCGDASDANDGKNPLLHSPIMPVQTFLETEDESEEF
jgi:hypothetical protein